jgi:hypothetical protein
MGLEVEQSFQHAELSVTAVVPCLCKKKAKHIRAQVQDFAGDPGKGAHHISSPERGEFMTEQTVLSPRRAL